MGEPYLISWDFNYKTRDFPEKKEFCLTSIVSAPARVSSLPAPSVVGRHSLKSVQFSCSVASHSFQSRGLQHARPPCLSPTPGVYSNSSPLSWWCHPTISSSAFSLSSRLQSFPASGFCPMSQFFASGGQTIVVSASATVLPMNIQDWFPLGWTDWISLQSKGLSGVFSNTTV